MAAAGSTSRQGRIMKKETNVTKKYHTRGYCRKPKDVSNTGKGIAEVLRNKQVEEGIMATTIVLSASPLDVVVQRILSAAEDAFARQFSLEKREELVVALKEHTGKNDEQINLALNYLAILGVL